MDTDKILDKLGIEALNQMQTDTSDAVLHTDKDIVVLSPTGSGKTLAYLLPLTARLHPESDEVQAVVIVPGRELALQSATILNNMGCGLRAMSLYGGRPTMDEHRKLRQVRPQVVFATPGRLNDHLDKGNISADKIEWAVLDEFDKCLEMGFRDEMSRLFGKLTHLKRRILLSATDTAEIPSFVSLNRCVRVDYLSDDEQVPERVTIYEVHSPEKDKLDTLSRLLRHLGEQSSIVFLNYRDSVERTDSYLREQGFTTSAFHGGMDQKAREDALYKFANGSANILVSTDLAARGLDIPNIDNIIHYHLPQGEDGYIHRVGRTARWESTGRTYFVLGPEEHLPEFLDCSPETYVIPTELPAPALPRMATIYIGKGKKDKVSKGDIVGFLCKKAGLAKDEIGRIDVNDRYAYAAVAREKIKQVLQLTKGEKIKGIRTVVEPVR